MEVKRCGKAEIRRGVSAVDGEQSEGVPDE